MACHYCGAAVANALMKGVFTSIDSCAIAATLLLRLHSNKCRETAVVSAFRFKVTESSGMDLGNFTWVDGKGFSVAPPLSSDRFSWNRLAPFRNFPLEHHLKNSCRLNEGPIGQLLDAKVQAYFNFLLKNQYFDDLIITTWRFSAVFIREFWDSPFAAQTSWRDELAN